MNEGLEGDVRKKLFDLIAKHPGLHLSKIAEEMNMRISLADYHLKYLEKNELIISVKNKGEYFRRYYTKESALGVDDKKILGILREEMLLNIILLLLKKEKLRHKEILSHFDITAPTLSYYLDKLTVSGIICVVRYGEEKGYSLVDKKQIQRLLFRYEFHEVAENFKAVWDDFLYW